MVEVPVVFKNEGMQIVGMLHKPNAVKKLPSVVFFHGCTGSRTEANWLFVKLARALAETGIMVLRFDFRHSGESEGNFENMTLSGEISDGFKSIEYLISECDADSGRVGVLGLSMGGVVGAYVTGLLGEKIKSCILMNPVGKPLEDISILATSRNVDITNLQKDTSLQRDTSFPVEWNSFLFGRNFFDDIQKINPLKIIKKAVCPVLIVSGSNDQSVLPVRSKEYFETVNNNGGTAELFVVEKADHVFSSVKWEREVIEKVGEWFSVTL